MKEDYIETTRRVVEKQLTRINIKLNILRSRESYLNKKVITSLRDPEVLKKWHVCYKQVEYIESVQKKLHTVLKTLTSI